MKTEGKSYVSALVQLTAFLGAFIITNVSAVKENVQKTSAMEVYPKKVINLVLILPADNRKMYSLDKVAPAVEYSAEKIHKNTTLLPNHDIRLHYHDSKCDISEAINQAFVAYTNGPVHAYFGPCCDYAAAPVVRQSFFWNIPMITSGAMAAVFGRSKRMKEKNYMMLTRVGPHFNSMVQFILKMISHYKWKKIKLYYEKHGQGYILQKFCHVATNSLYDIFVASNISTKYVQYETKAKIAENVIEFANFSGRLRFIVLYCILSNCIILYCIVFQPNTCNSRPRQK